MAERAENLSGSVYDQVRIVLEGRKDIIPLGLVIDYHTSEINPSNPSIIERVRFVTSRRMLSGFQEDIPDFSKIIPVAGEGFLPLISQACWGKYALAAGGEVDVFNFGFLSCKEPVNTQTELLKEFPYHRFRKTKPEASNYSLARRIIVNLYPSFLYAQQILQYHQDLVMGIGKSNQQMEWLTRSISLEQINFLNQSKLDVKLMELPPAPALLEKTRVKTDKPGN